MRASLFLTVVLAVATTAAAQDAPEARADSASGASAEVAPRTARLALPTRGGVFYYRAGPGRGVRTRTLVSPDTARADRPPVASGVVAADSRPVGLAEASTRATERDVTREDLDRLEARVLDALDRSRTATDRQRPIDAPPPATSRGEPAVIVPVVPRATDAPPSEETYREVPVVIAPVAPVPVQTDDSPRTAATPEAAPEPDVPLATAPETRPAPEAAPPTVEQIERDILDAGLFRTTYVHFAFAQSDLLPLSRQTLDAVATVLRRYPDLRIEIGGHTDSVGSDATNDRLSGERAGAVAAYLVASGVAAERLRAVGYGERVPVATNDDETGRALNRRVEFVVLNPEAGQRLR